jgi:hypothetical protein
MSADEGTEEPKYEVWVNDTIHSWDKDTISVAELRELGGLPEDCPMTRCTPCRRAIPGARS